MTEQTISDMQQEMRELEKTENWTGYIVADLRSAFEAVQNEEHWKGPIDAEVVEQKVAVTYWAIVYYTATTPSVYFDERDRTFRITSEGYWAGPAGP